MMIVVTSNIFSYTVHALFHYNFFFAFFIQYLLFNIYISVTLTKDFSATDSKITISIVDVVMDYNVNLQSAIII